MALNITIFSGSGSADSVVEQTATVVPEYVSYTMLFLVSMSIPVVIVPSLLAIFIIFRNKRLQTNNNIFLINLLFTDIGIALALCCYNGLLTVLYLLGINVDVDCRIILISTITLVTANKLSFIPMCVDRFIHIAFPFSYKRIVTTKGIIITIITLWMVAIVVSISLFIEPYAFDYIPSVGICRRSQFNIPAMMIVLLCFLIPILLITLTSIYLRYRIIKSNNFFYSVKRNAAQETKSLKAGRLAEILREQVKPTLAVFRVGGIDAALDILIVLISVVASFLNPSSSATCTFIVITRFMVIPIQYIQSANHSLVYNCDIREKMFDCIRMRNKRSKVMIVSHRE